MEWRVAGVSLVVLVAGILCGLVGCAKKEPVVLPSPQVVDDSKFQEHVARGDSFFSQSHLYGWRKAETEYELALGIRVDADVVQKLILTQFLILDREIDEEIYASAHEERLSSICDQGTTGFQKMLCGMARAQLRGSGVIDEEPPTEGLKFEIDPALEESNRVLAGYLRLHYLRDHFPPAYSEEFQKLMLVTRECPVTIYLKLQEGLLEDSERFVSRYPHYAELFVHEGQVQLGLEKYSDGIASMEQALSLVPDYSRALLELGNVYLFSLQHYERALDCYERTLGSDPKNVQALFGKGAVLHYLGEHSSSQVVLDRLLDEKSSRWGTVPEDFHDYYLGQGYYYRAYNYYVMGFPVESRKWVDFARRFRPNAEGPNYLSGVLRFEEGDIASAQADFHKVVDGGTDLCDAYYRLGQIAFREKTRDTLPYFMNNGYCLEQDIHGVQVRLERVPTLDLDQTTKNELTLAIKDALKERREAAIASIFSMMNTARSTDRFNSVVFLQSMEELLDRVANDASSSSK